MRTKWLKSKTIVKGEIKNFYRDVKKQRQKLNDTDCGKDKSENLRCEDTRIRKSEENIEGQT